jgi:hypothetical protein
LVFVPFDDGSTDMPQTDADSNDFPFTVVFGGGAGEPAGALYRIGTARDGDASMTTTARSRGNSPR